MTFPFCFFWFLVKLCNGDGVDGPSGKMETILITAITEIDILVFSFGFFSPSQCAFKNQKEEWEIFRIYILHHAKG